MPRFLGRFLQNHRATLTALALGIAHAFTFAPWGSDWLELLVLTGFAGLLLVALILGKIRKTGRITWTMPVPANLALRNFGLSLFLAQVGMASGETFVQTVTHSGVYLLVGIVFVTVLSLVVLLLSLHVFKLPFDMAAGVMSGATGNPAIIAFTSRTLGTDKPDIGYAMIFPSMTILKIVMVHILGAVLGVG